MTTTRTITVALILVVALAACGGGSTADTTGPSTTGPAASTSSTTTLPSTTTPTTVPDWRLPRVHDDPGPGWSITADGVWVSEPTVRDPEWYAEVAGITVEEAERRNRMIEEASETHALDRFRSRGWSGGIWTEETPEGWQMVVATVDLGDTERQVGGRWEGTELIDSVVFREVEHSANHLEHSLVPLEEMIEQWCLPPLTMAEIDLYGNRVVVGVQDVGEFVAAAEMVELDLGTFVVVEHRVSPPPARATGCGLVDIADLEAAQDLWESHGITDYRYLVSGGSAWGTRGYYDVTVTNGDVDSLMLVPPNWPSDDDTWTRDFDSMFDWAASDWEPGSLEVRVHPDWGFITSLNYDHPWMIDEEWRYRIVAFAPAGEPLVWADVDGLPCYSRNPLLETPLASTDLIDRAIYTALWDPQAHETMILHGHCEVSTAVAPDLSSNPDTPILVTVNLDPPLFTADWPLEYCPPEDDFITGIAWLLDPTGDTVLEISPIWNATTTCLTRLPIDQPPLPDYLPEEVCGYLCNLTDTEIGDAIRIAVDDPYLQELLLLNGYRVPTVWRRKAALTTGPNEARVSLWLYASIPAASSPLEPCGPPIDSVHGIRITVNLDQQTIVETCAT